jgi:hypothetical protein
MSPGRAQAIQGLHLAQRVADVTSRTMRSVPARIPPGSLNLILVASERECLPLNDELSPVPLTERRFPSTAGGTHLFSWLRGLRYTPEARRRGKALKACRLFRVERTSHPDFVGTQTGHVWTFCYLRA